MSQRTAEDLLVAGFELAALRLHLAIGMAAADDHLHSNELAAIHELVNHCHVTAQDRSRLRKMTQRLLAQPPDLDSLLRSIIEHADKPGLAQLLIDDVIAVAHIDDMVDPREEGLLRLVCGALGVDPASLYAPEQRAAADVSAEELAQLVRDLLQLDTA
jgi:tellurite resistance protein